MLERSRIWDGPWGALRALPLALALASGACATSEEKLPEPQAAAPSAPVKAEPAPAPAPPKASPEEARALLAQAETDIHRARARRALWARAWEALVGARAAMERGDADGSIRLSKRASELAQLGLEQLAYPAVKLQASRSPP